MLIQVFELQVFYILQFFKSFRLLSSDVLISLGYRNKAVLCSVAPSDERCEAAVYSAGDADSFVRRDHRSEPPRGRWERGAGHVCGSALTRACQLGGEGSHGGSGGGGLARPAAHDPARALA